MGSENEPAGIRAALLARRRNLFWRIHFWSALIASPFALVAALTGLLYVFTPQIEAALYGQLDRVAPGPVMRTLDEAVAAAQLAAPGGARLHSVIPAHAAGDTVRVHFVPMAPAAEVKDEGGSGHGHGYSHGHGQTSTQGNGMPAASRPSFGLPGQTVVVHVDPYGGSAGIAVFFAESPVTL